MNWRLGALGCFVAAAVVSAVAGQDTPRFRAETTYVEVDVFVTDRRGEFVRGLTKDDFELLEDGRPQVISDLQFVDIPVAPTESVREPGVPPDVVTNVGERRAYVLLMEPGGGPPQRIQNIAYRLVDELLGPNDMMAVIHPQGSMSFAQAFTSNKALLRQSIRELPRSGAIDGSWDAVCGSLRFRNSFRAIEEVSERLGRIGGRRKAIIWFNARLVSDPLLDDACKDTTAAFIYRDAMRVATRHNVAIYPIHPLPSVVGLAADREFKMNYMARGVAEDTGGIAVVNTNNFSPAFAAIARDNSTYYLLGYYPSTEWRDGKFHTLTVRVHRPGVTVRARRGYYAPEPDRPDRPPPPVPDGLSPEAIRALRSPLPTNGLTMTVFAAPFKGTDGRGSVLLGAQLHGPDLKLDADDRIELTHLTIDTRGTITPGPRSTFTLNLRDATREAASATGFRYVERLELPPGRHEVRLMAHQLGGATGSVVTHVDVPNYSRDPLHLSGIVLGSARATGHRMLRDDEALAEMLPMGPTALRRFGRDDTLTAFAEVYTETRTRPEDVRLTATVTRARGGRVRSEAATRMRSEPGLAGYTAVIPLSALAPGDYVLTLEARAGRRTATRQVPFAVVE
jgi:VWFA-related protein